MTLFLRHNRVGLRSSETLETSVTLQISARRRLTVALFSGSSKRSNVRAISRRDPRERFTARRESALPLSLDAHGVSFVSVTQQFNTTTSMGRLTLNVTQCG
jgi:hypothetical protein